MQRRMVLPVSAVVIMADGDLSASGCKASISVTNCIGPTKSVSLSQSVYGRTSIANGKFSR